MVRDRLVALIRAELVECNIRMELQMTLDEIQQVTNRLADRLVVGREDHRSGRRLYDRMRERVLSYVRGWDFHGFLDKK